MSRGERAATAAAIDLLLSLESYELLAIAQGMSARHTGDVLRHGLRALLAPRRAGK